MARNRSIVGWVFYDFAAVVFAMNVAGLYFPLWVVEDAGGRASDRIGPRATIVRVLWLWVGVLTLCASIPAFGLPRELF